MSYKHGMAGTRLYKVWDDMKQRVINKKTPYWKNYGGRGITLCEEWYDFITFRDWALTHNYSDKLFIDRIDNSRNYEPNNCRFITKSESNVNRRKGKDFCIYKTRFNTFAVQVSRNCKTRCVGNTKTIENARELRDLYISKLEY